MRTLLVGEGVHELGDNQNTGALAMLVGRLARTSPSLHSTALAAGSASERYDG